MIYLTPAIIQLQADDQLLKINNIKCQNYDFKIDKITVLFGVTQLQNN